MTKQKKIMNSKASDNPFILSFIILVISVFLISGCGPVTGGDNNKYHVGTDGVSAEFFKSNPDSVFEQDTFSISLFLKNLGSYTINSTTPGRLSINYDDYYMTLDDTTKKTIQVALHGKDREEPMGGEEYYEFLFTTRTLNSLMDSIKTSISYSLCYPYRTELSIGTCIDTKISSQDQRVDACKTQVYTDSQGQGGPVVITKIEPEVHSVDAKTVRPQFKIFVENRGNGYVLLRKTATEDICNAININRTSPTLNRISVHASLSNIEMTCNPPELQLKDSGDNYFRCYVSDANTNQYVNTRMNYVAPLTVSLDYGYVEVISKNIEIKRKYDYEIKSKRCGFYEVEDGSNCISLCEFCARPANTNDARCQKNLNIANWSGFKDFSCLCSKAKCTSLNGQGLCVFGYCSGEQYCCKTDACVGKADGSQCEDNFVCVNEKCNQAITECTWKATHDTTHAKYSCMTDASCNQTTIEKGLCPGNINLVCCKPNFV